MFTKYENEYASMKKEINSKLWSTSHREQSTPRLDIPVFHGHYQQWVSFKDLFTEAIHSNPCLSNAQKMQFLKSKIKGEPERLIQHLPISSDNYVTCWEILNHRYNNKKLIFTTHINNVMTLPVLQQATSSHIKRLHDVTIESLNGIKNLSVNIDTWDPILVYLLTQKLDSETHNEYMASLKQPRELPSLKEFLSFLESKFTAMESSRRKQEAAMHKTSLNTPSTSNSQHKPSRFKQYFTSNKATSSTVYNEYKRQCPVCQEDHGVYFCTEFKDIAPGLKRKTIAKLNLCSNCLHNHNGKACHSAKRCQECNGYHNTLLHDVFCNQIATSGYQTRQQGNGSHVAQEHDPKEQPNVLLATALIKIIAKDGVPLRMRALVDQGSEICLISENAAQQLGLPRNKCKGVITGVGTNDNICKGMLKLNCLSSDEQYSFITNAFIMKSLTRNLPNTTFSKSRWELLDTIPLADPKYYVSNSVDLLLGAEVYASIIMEGIHKHENLPLIAQQSRLGWILSGKVQQSFQCNLVLNNIEDIQKFWEVEDIPEQTFNTSEEDECIQFYQETTTRLADGRYQVRIPLKKQCLRRLGHSKGRAIMQFRQLENKFKKNNSIAQQYKLFIQECLALGHMTLAPIAQWNKSIWKAPALQSDDKIPNDVNAKWKKFKQDLTNNINAFKIPRWIGTSAVSDIELHAFSDATLRTYACVIYAKIIVDGQANIILLTGKSRLVPNSKTISLPKFELSGAHLVAKLMIKVKQCLTNHNIKVYGRVDSTAVLGWIKGNPSRWKTFVANRVRQITEAIPPESWRYVKSADNPADSHFLNTGPTLTLIETEKDLRTRWQLTQKILQDLWKRWRTEYLAQLNTRSKWKRPLLNININDVVLIHDDNLPPGKWAMGRVIELHPGQDGYVRVVTLKTKNGTLKRPVLKLSILSEHTEDEPTKNDQGNTSQKQDINKENHVSRKPHRSSANKAQFTLTSMFAALLLFLSCISSGQCNVNVIPFRETQGLYFDKLADMMLIRDEWKLIIYYNMEPYWEATDALQKYTRFLKDTCEAIKTQVHCDVISLQQRHGFSELEYYNQLLLSQHLSTRLTAQRTRRGLINGVGYVANSLFGVLDERFAEQYQKDIALLRDNAKYMASLWKNQTSIVEGEYNLLKRTEETMTQQHKIIHQHMNSLEKAFKNLQDQIQTNNIINDFNTGAIIASNMLHNLRGLQNVLLDTITDIYHGRFNLHLLTPEQLINELSTIASSLPRDVSLPIDNLHSDLRKIYELLKVKTRVMEDVLIFEIRIPLISRDIYELFKVIPIPKRTGSKITTVVPVSSYVSINMKKDTNIPISEYDVRTCSALAEAYFCYIKLPIYQMKGDNSFYETDKLKCKTVTTSRKNDWLESNALNTYIYFCCEQCHVRTLCADQVTAHQLTNAGLITVGQGCIIKTDNFSVFPHKPHWSELKMKPDVYNPVMPPINHVINITIPHTQEKNESEDLLRETTKLGEKITKLKEIQLTSEKISYHDIHHYAMIYVILGGIGVVALCIIVRRVQWRVPPTPSPAVAQEPPAGPAPPAPRAPPRARCAEAPETSQFQHLDCSETASVSRVDKSTSPKLKVVTFH